MIDRLIHVAPLWLHLLAIRQPTVLLTEMNALCSTQPTVIFYPRDPTHVKPVNKSRKFSPRLTAFLCFGVVRRTLPRFTPLRFILEWTQS